MAVRRCIQRLFQEPQVDGAITFERPGPALQSWGRPSREDAGMPRGGELQREPNSPGGGTLLPRGLRLEECALFHCRGCRAVLGDSLHLCAQEDRCLRVLVCFKVTNDVVLDDSLMVGIEGALLGCAYYALYCRSCGLMVGFSLYSAFAALVHLRGLFCLFKDSILCYLLKTKAIIEASEMNFPALSLKEHLGKLKEQLVGVHVRLELLIKRLEELNQQINVADKQGYASRTIGLKPGFAGIKSNH
ncbi:protein Mis18-beta [Chelonia mydas]|uniref:Protein Mis18-beta n=1 Tax=Chelonia mydas TaxID=8469 RepID=M7C560_CHEMY|nr:protein Mis18-beta [Chelonia mydas]EMP39618.1 Protein Mis18-beta [Chelonia mydas]